MGLLPLDGPALQSGVIVTTGTVVAAKVGVTELVERKAITLQSLNDDIYVYFGDDTGIAPSTLIVQTSGLVVYLGEKATFEATSSQRLYILAINNATTVIVVERA
jgi:hypothetical protein